MASRVDGLRLRLSTAISLALGGCEETVEPYARVRPSEAARLWAKPPALKMLRTGGGP